jgi:hypothetical protein
MKNKSTFSCTEYQRLQIDFATFDTIVYFILKFKTKFFVEKNYRNVLATHNSIEKTFPERKSEILTLQLTKNYLV